MPGSEANASAGHHRWFTKPSKPGNYTGKASANPKLHELSTSAEPPSAASWSKTNPNLRSLAGRTRWNTRTDPRVGRSRRGPFGGGIRFPLRKTLDSPLPRQSLATLYGAEAQVLGSTGRRFRFSEKQTSACQRRQA